MSELQCNGCTLCCEGDTVPLHPHESHFRHTFEDGFMVLEKGPDGNCVYLEKGVGCKTHHNRPALCQNFDCRKYLFLTRAEYMERRRANPNFKKIVNAAKKQPPIKGTR